MLFTTIQAFTIVWLVFGLSFVFMINLMMMDHIRNFSKKLVQSSKKSIRKLRKYTRRSKSEGSLRIKRAMQKKTPLKRVKSAPTRSAWEELRKGSYKNENKNIYIVQDGEFHM